MFSTDDAISLILKTTKFKASSCVEKIFRVKFFKNTTKESLLRKVIFLLIILRNLLECSTELFLNYVFLSYFLFLQNILIVLFGRFCFFYIVFFFVIRCLPCIKDVYLFLVLKDYKIFYHSFYYFLY